MTGIPMGTEIPTPSRPFRMRRFRRLRRRSAVAVIAVGVAVLLTFNIGRQVVTTWNVNQERAAVEAQVAAAEAANAELQRYLDYLNSDAYTDVAARQLRDVGSSGEQLLIIPTGAAVQPTGSAAGSKPADPPLLEQWLDLFFGP